MLVMLTCTKPSCTIIVRWTLRKGKDVVVCVFFFKKKKECRLLTVSPVLEESAVPRESGGDEETQARLSQLFSARK